LENTQKSVLKDVLNMIVCCMVLQQLNIIYLLLLDIARMA